MPMVDGAVWKLGNPQVERIEAALLKRMQDTRGSQSFRSRPKQDGSCRGPGLRVLAVAPSRRQARHFRSILPDGNRGAQFTSVRKIRLEGSFQPSNPFCGFKIHDPGS